MNVPEDLQYAATHEWLRLDGDSGTVGITDHAQAELTDVVYVELPKVGAKVARGGSCAVAESTKAASDVYAPISGEIIDANAELGATPQLVNESPYDKGWLFKLKLANKGELKELLAKDAYAKSAGV